ncbi:hypothetical protein N0V90_004598 [Kalmusia sp. IMI 367209]|nr:hypothetical protein N0V90_004598 [Kalmusia sp. IMI 367209]
MRPAAKSGITAISMRHKNKRSMADPFQQLESPNVGALPDAEKASDKKENATMPIPCTLLDIFIERVLHPICAVSLLVLTIGILVLDARILLVDASSESYRTLVPAAFRYNKAALDSLPDSSRVEFDTKGLTIIVGALSVGVMAGLGAVILVYISCYVPRDKLIRTSWGIFMEELHLIMTIEMSMGVAVLAYSMFLYETDPAHGSGCYTYTSRKGKEAMKWMALSTIPCTVVLLAIYQRMKILHCQYTTPQQRQELAEKELREKKRKRELKEEEEREHKWYRRDRTWAIVGALCTLYYLVPQLLAD